MQPAENFHANKRRKNGLDYRCKSCSSGYHKERNGTEVGKANQRERNLQWCYGISSEKYDEMLSNQDGGCAICGTPESESKRGVLFVDHCHVSGDVRGLLCHYCNSAIGYFKDDKELMSKAMEYLS